MSRLCSARGHASSFIHDFNHYSYRTFTGHHAIINFFYYRPLQNVIRGHPICTLSCIDLLKSHSHKFCFHRKISYNNGYKSVYEICRLAFVKRLKLLWSFVKHSAINNKMESEIIPPTAVKGMKILRREDFSKTVQFPTITVPIKVLGHLTGNKTFKKTMLRRFGIKPVMDVDTSKVKNNESKMIILDVAKYPNVDAFSTEELGVLNKFCVDLTTWKIVNIELTYDNWSYQEILKAILPDDADMIAGFSAVGHILHLNLRDSHQPYKAVIGQVLLDKVKYARTVVNKTSNIDNTYRNFKMEIVAGEENLVVTCKEHGIAYQFDFSKVYWNSRLSTEHRRIVDTLKSDDVVYDVFAGVGPFAIPAARKGCRVLANDLNPDSWRWLESNARANKIEGERLLTYNMDGRQFIREVVKEDLFRVYGSEFETLRGISKPWSELELGISIPILESVVKILEPNLEHGISNRELKSESESKIMKPSLECGISNSSFESEHKIFEPSLELGISNSMMESESGAKVSESSSELGISNPVLHTEPKISEPRLEFQISNPESNSESESKILENDIAKASQNFHRQGNVVFVMNLPALAIDCLDSFRGLFSGAFPGKTMDQNIIDVNRLPIVHCYSFGKRDGEPRTEILGRIREALGFPILGPESVEIRYVRDVSPGKDMYCATFRLTEEILFGKFWDEVTVGSGQRGEGASSQEADEDSISDQPPPEKKVKMSQKKS